MSLSSILAVPPSVNGHAGIPGTVAVPLTVYGTSLPLICPDAVPVAEMPLAQVAVNVPLSDVAVWLVTCHENPPHELAAMPAIGLELQVPSSEAGEEGSADGLGADSAVGASIVDVCSKPAHAPVVTAAAIRPAKSVCFIVVPHAAGVVCRYATA